MRQKRRYNRYAELPPLDVDEFNALTDLLYECTHGNRSAITRILGIDRRTWDKWIKSPPTWPWWNIVLRMAIKEIMTGMTGRRGSPTVERQRHIREALARIPHNTQLLDEISLSAWEYREAEIHLRTLLLHGPLAWSKIKLPANSGGFTHRQLRAAAKSIGVIRERSKQGDSYWRLPEVGED